MNIFNKSFYYFCSSMQHIEYMKYALNMAEKAQNVGEVPVGAVITKDNEVIATGYNQTISKNDIMQHAEVVAIQSAFKYLNNFRLHDCSLYVTLEPCMMCLGLILSSRVNNLYIGLADHKNGIISNNKLDFSQHNINIYNDIMHRESNKLIKSFFQSRR